MPHQSHVTEMSAAAGMKHNSPEMQQCLTNCLDCHRICLATVPHCLQMGGQHAAATHIGLLLDCAEICQTSANFMLRMSDFHTRVCAVCAEICDRCAQDCQQLANGDALMQQCAETCRRCAESCRQMAAQATQA